MINTPQQLNTYYSEIPIESPTFYYGAVEERCEHLEEVIYSTLELLRVVITDFHSPSLTPLLGAILERLYSITAFMETGLTSAPGLDENK